MPTVSVLRQYVTQGGWTKSGRGFYDCSRLIKPGEVINVSVDDGPR